MEENAIRKRNGLFQLILIGIVLSGLFHVSQQDFEPINPKPSSELQEPTVLVVEMLENQSMGWFRSRIVLNVTSDIPINMSYYVSGIGASAEKIPETNSNIFVISSISSEIEIFIQPHWSVFPSSFQYHFMLYYINATTHIAQNIFEIPLGTFNIIMGVPLSIILGSILVLGIIIIVARPVRLRDKKGPSSSGTDYSYNEPIETTSPVPSSSQSTPSTVSEAGKIQCPECKLNIAEGSAFCPECGFHIPRFLRTRE